MLRAVIPVQVPRPPSPQARRRNKRLPTPPRPPKRHLPSPPQPPSASSYFSVALLCHRLFVYRYRCKYIYIDVYR